MSNLEHIEYRNLKADLGISEKAKRDISERGCFVLEGCLEPTLVRRVHESLVKLFTLAPEEKKRYVVDKTIDPLGHGYSPYGVSKALDTGIPNLLETWDISPTKMNWPSHMAEEWTAIREYQSALASAARKGLELLATSLDTGKEHFVELLQPDSIEGIHLIHYFPIQEAHDPSARRQSEHCDNTLITLIPPPLPLDSGICVFNRSTETWEVVTTSVDSCIVQAGLVLEAITAGKIKANLHTVTNPSLGSECNISRYSTPFFCSPRRGTTLTLRSPFSSSQGDVSLGTIEDFESRYFSSIFKQ